MTEEDSGPQISGEPTVIHVNQGPTVHGGQVQSTNAIVALVLAIISLMTFLSLCFAGCFGPNLCLAIPGLILGNSDRTMLQSNPSHPEAGMINAAYWINVVGIVLGVLGLLLYALIIGLFGIAALSA